MSKGETIPLVGRHRGVGLHAFQPAERIERVVKPEIEAVARLTDPAALAGYAADVMRSPEARLYAAARVEALHEMATQSRVARPDVDIDLLRARVSGLDSLAWMSPRHYGTLLEHPPSPGASRLPERDPRFVEQAQAASDAAAHRNPPHRKDS